MANSYRCFVWYESMTADRGRQDILCSVVGLGQGIGIGEARIAWCE